MYFNLSKITKIFYIDELKNFKDYASTILTFSNGKLQTRKKILEQELLDIDNSDLDENDKECAYQEFQYKLSLNELQYYKVHSALYQLLFSIWENQVRDYFKSESKTKINKILNKYNEDIRELNLLVNALKHGKGQSCNTLKEYYQKYFRNSFVDILPGIHGCEILDISESNLILHCDKIIDIWSQDI